MANNESIKLLINGVSGAGKTELLRSLGAETFVVSRDSKKFALPIPYMLVDTYYDMDTLLYGGNVKDEEGNDVYIQGITDKLEIYIEKHGKMPENVVIDTVSQITMDVIEAAAPIPTAWGEQGAFITKEMAKLTRFIHEYLELNGITVILLNHIIPEKEDGKFTGKYSQFGQGKFLNKGGFYSTTNEAITIVVEGKNRVVYTNDIEKFARTMLTDVPEKWYVENTKFPEKSKKLKEGETYFNLKHYLDLLKQNQINTEEWAI